MLCLLGPLLLGYLVHQRWVALFNFPEPSMATKWVAQGAARSLHTDQTFSIFCHVSGGKKKVFFK